MNVVVDKLKSFLLKIRGFFPKRLPHSLDGFDEWFKFLMDAYKIPNFPSYRQAFATMIMHLPNNVSHKAPYYFAKCIRKAISQEVAFEIIDRYRKEPREQRESSQTGSSNEPISEQKA